MSVRPFVEMENKWEHRHSLQKARWRHRSVFNRHRALLPPASPEEIAEGGGRRREGKRETEAGTYALDCREKKKKLLSELHSRGV